MEIKIEIDDEELQGKIVTHLIEKGIYQIHEVRDIATGIVDLFRDIKLEVKISS